MHYAQKIKLENEKYQDAVSIINSDITDLMIYLRSSKFQHDPMVNTADVLMRLTEIQNSLWVNTP
jgi:hypothetical protein